MNTLNTIIDSMLIETNEEIIGNLSKLGYSRAEATKVVSEFSDFDLVEDAALNPVSAF
jgi:Holliday junction resolvasome RuvABC DNA-binding subunit